MAFSGGTFSRLFSWVGDQAAGIKILASRMDQEMSGFATGLSTCICKDGQSIATAMIPFAQGLSLGDGAVATPSLAFTADVDNGFYRLGANNWAAAAGGVKGLELTADAYLIATLKLGVGMTPVSPLDVTGAIAGPAASILNSTSGQVSLFAKHSHATNPYGIAVQFTGGAPNNTTNYFFSGIDNNTTRVNVFSNGNIVNANNSYGAISAREVKQDIVPANDHWETVKALSSNLVNYRLKADVAEIGDAAQVLTGGLAEEWEAIDADLVFEDGNTGLKCINYSGAYTRALQALGKALVRIEALEARLAAVGIG